MDARHNAGHDDGEACALGGLLCANRSTGSSFVGWAKRSEPTMDVTKDDGAWARRYRALVHPTLACLGHGAGRADQAVGVRRLRRYALMIFGRPQKTI